MADLTTQSHVDLAPVETVADSDGRRRVVTTERIEAGEVIVPLLGTLCSRPTRYSIQVGERAHLDDIPVVEATNHACEPTAFIDFAEEGRVYVRALRDLGVGEEVTIDYCATEEDMTSPFRCDCGSSACYGLIRGFRFLRPAQRKKIDGLLSPFLRDKYRR